MYKNFKIQLKMIDEKKRFLDEKPVAEKLEDSYDSVTRQFSYNLQPEVNELLREFRTGHF